VSSIRLLGISGSLRRDSYNTVLLHACRELAPDEVEVEVRRLEGVPLFDRDVEAEGYPDAVADLRAAIDEADGLLLATPEYNWSISGVMKNAIDWASRGKDSPLDHKPTALLSAAGGGGGRRAQAHMRDVLQHNRVDVLEPSVQVPRAWDHIDDGRLTTPEHRDAVRDLVAALCAHILDLRTVEPV
jgi:chromate reductase, NAD(P)H dehydrogenase (quinone)